MVFYRNFVPFEMFDFKNAVTLKTGLRVREGHWIVSPFDRVHTTFC